MRLVVMTKTKRNAAQIAASAVVLGISAPLTVASGLNLRFPQGT